MRAKPSQAYRDRRGAGEILAVHRQDRLVRPNNAVVPALPSGGMPVGVKVARVLDAELSVFVVRKLGVSGHEEFAMGAIAAAGFEILNEQMISGPGIGVVLAKWQFTYTYVVRSKEFKAQRDVNQFGSITISRAF